MTMTPTTATTMPMPMPTTTTTTMTMTSAGVTSSSSTSSPRSSLMCSTAIMKRKRPKSKAKAKTKTKTKLTSKLSLAGGHQQQRRKSRRPSVFPQRLYDLLQKSDEATTTDAPLTSTTSRAAANANTIIAWTPDGLAFRVFTEHHEESTIIQLFKANNFNLSKYKSFTKQLTLYNFKRICKGWYSHQLFQRGRPELFYKKSMKDFELAATGTKGGGGGASSLALPASSSAPRPEAFRPDDAVSYLPQQSKPASISSATLFPGMAVSSTESSRTSPASDDDTDADTTTTAMMDWALPTPVPPSAAQQHPHQPLLSSTVLAIHPANGSDAWRSYPYSAPTSVVSVSPPLTPTSSYHDFAAVPDPLATLSLLPSSTSTRFAAPAPARDHQYYYADPSHGSTTNNVSNMPSYRKQYKRVSLDNSVMSNCYTNSTSNSCNANANANMLPAMLRSLPPSSNNSSNITDLFNANMLPTMVRSLPPSSNSSSNTIDLFEDLFNFDNTYDVGDGGTTRTGGSGRGNNSTDNGSTTELEFAVVTANDIEDLVSMMVHEHDQPVAMETHVRNTMYSTPPNHHQQLGNSSNRNDEQHPPQQHPPKTTTTTTIQFTANEMEMMTFG